MSEPLVGQGKGSNDEGSWGVPRLTPVVDAIRKSGVAPEAWWPQPKAVEVTSEELEKAIERSGAPRAIFVDPCFEALPISHAKRVQEVVERMIVGVDEPECDTPTIVDQPAGAE